MNKRKLLLPAGSVIRKDDYLPFADKNDNLTYDKYGFISLHKSLFSVSMWCLCTPVSLIDNAGNRPEFEKLQGTFTEMLMKAIDIAVENDTFVVIVDDPITGKISYIDYLPVFQRLNHIDIENKPAKINSITQNGVHP
jgi:hypothetical protein